MTTDDSFARWEKAARALEHQAALEPVEVIAARLRGKAQGIRFVRDELRALQADVHSIIEAIETHREKVMLLGHRPDERTGKPVWGGQFDRDLWRVLGSGYPSGCPPHDFDLLRQCKKCGLGSVRDEPA